MTLEIRHAASGLTIDADIPTDLVHVLEVQWARSQASAHLDGFQSRVTLAVIEALRSNIDWDLQAPTVKQCNFASVIARKLSVPVPEEARRFRGAMAEFLAEFAPQLEAPKPKKVTSVAKQRTDPYALDDDPF
jgi:hypothetical protein